ncbi:SMC5-SMC6 complex localization factor 1-like protein [Labeo rohita]|uniref:SMC5-SMC6 complex localization factor 1-like protein n=1 Tax=Labeo rohita TaxID=84645 RepID=A0A498MNM4_LABRO|nr:SMC5-SMC6 complex localization factor 1-like protein [Labeo rohita]
MYRTIHHITDISLFQFQVYKEATTHLVVQKALPSEKFLAACAGGKWIVTPEFVLDSVTQNAWLPEASYELNLTAQNPETPNPLKTWRKRVANGTVSGAFQDWVVLIDIDDTARRSVFVSLESFDEEQSCKMPIEAAAETDVSMDVTDDLSHKELEEMLKEYIIIMEV